MATRRRTWAANRAIIGNLILGGQTKMETSNAPRRHADTPDKASVLTDDRTTDDSDDRTTATTGRQRRHVHAAQSCRQPNVSPTLALGNIYNPLVRPALLFKPLSEIVCGERENNESITNQLHKGRKERKHLDTSYLSVIWAEKLL